MSSARSSARAAVGVTPDAGSDRRVDCGSTSNDSQSLRRRCFRSAKTHASEARIRELERWPCSTLRLVSVLSRRIESPRTWTVSLNTVGRRAGQ